MTRKDFELIARAVRHARPTVSPADHRSGSRGWAVVSAGHMTANHVALFLADELAATNPRFDRERFLKACGVE